MGPGRLRVDRTVYDQLKSASLGWTISPSEDQASVSAPIATAPNAHESWSQVTGPLTLTRVSGGLEIEAIIEGTRSASLTLGYCEPWCASGDLCECDCSYEAPAAPIYELIGQVDQGWSEP